MSVVLAFQAFVKLRIDFTNFGLNNKECFTLKLVQACQEPQYFSFTRLLGQNMTVINLQLFKTSQV